MNDWEEFQAVVDTAPKFLFIVEESTGQLRQIWDLRQKKLIYQKIPGWAQVGSDEDMKKKLRPLFMNYEAKEDSWAWTRREEAYRKYGLSNKIKVKDLLRRLE